MKLLITFILTLTIVFAPQNTAYATNVNDETLTTDRNRVDEYNNKLKEVFPEYATEINQAQNESSLIINNFNTQNSKEKEVVISESRMLDNNTEYTLKMFEDGSYMAMQSIIGSYQVSGGSSSGGSGYMNVYNRTITVWQSGGLFAMTISPISYTIAYGAYDSFNELGFAILGSPSPINAYPSKISEDASGPAYAYYNGTNTLFDGQTPTPMQVKLELGNDQLRVYLNEIQL